MRVLSKIVLILSVIFFSACVDQKNLNVLLDNTHKKIDKLESQDIHFRLNMDGHLSAIYNMITDKEGNLITASSDKHVKVIDTHTGVTKRTFLTNIEKGNDTAILDVALSEDEKYIAISVSRLNKKNQDIEIFDYKSGKKLHNLKLHNELIIKLLFSKKQNNKSYLISGANDGKVAFWDVQDDFKLVNSIDNIEDNLASYIHSMTIYQKNNEQYLAYTTLNYKEHLNIYNINGKKFVKKILFDSDIRNMQTRGLSSNDKHIALNIGTEIYIYDTNSFKIIKKIKAPKLIKPTNRKTTYFTQLEYSNKNKYLVAGTAELGSISYNIKNNYREHVTYNPKNSLAFNVHRRIVLLKEDYCASADRFNHNIHIWNIKTGLQRSILKNNTKKIYEMGIRNNSIGFSKVNEFVNKVDRKDNLYQFENTVNLDGKELELKIKTDNLFYMNASKKVIIDNKKYRVRHRDRTLNVYKNSKFYNSFEFERSLIFSYWFKDFIVVTNDVGSIFIIDIKNNKRYQLSGSNSNIIQISIDNDNGKMAVLGTSSRIMIWDYNKLLESINNFPNQIINPQINLFVSNKNDLIMWTPEGFFDASKGAGKYIGYHINRGYDKEAEFVTVENMYSSFYRPDLVQKALKGESLEKYAKQINIDKLINAGFAPSVKILTKNQTVENGDLNVKVQVCPKNGGYDNLAFMINEVPISVTGTSRALKIKKKAKREDCFIIDETLALASGKNEIGFKATNKVGNIESKIDTITVNYDDSQIKKTKMALQKITGKQNVNDLHILAVGVNDYDNKDWKLSLAVNDGRGMLKTIKAVAEPLFNKIHTYELFDKKASKENIIKTFKNIKSTRDDVFLLFVAGHGLTDEFNGDYYFIPVDMMDVNKLKEQGLGQKDLMLGLSKVTALKSLVLLDTCHSGALVEADMQKTTTNKLSRATGRAILSASSSVQLAKEGYKGHGLFTYTLMEALKGKGYYGDEKITVNELADYTEDTLPKRALDVFNHRQTPQRSMYGTDFNIGEFEW